MGITISLNLTAGNNVTPMGDGGLPAQAVFTQPSDRGNDYLQAARGGIHSHPEPTATGGDLGEHHYSGGENDGGVCSPLRTPLPAKFPANREIYRVYCRFWLIWRIYVFTTCCLGNIFCLIPYTSQQGINLPELGKSFPVRAITGTFFIVQLQSESTCLSRSNLLEGS